jgi:NAD(P)-dependent dehydrogenase (short-subunit alcohol dehydrogenase family)
MEHRTYGDHVKRNGKREWTTADVPDQRGRTVVITGANSGIGFELATMFAGLGATVVLACRDVGKAAVAVDRITAREPGCRLSAVPLDLASLTSIRRAADRIRGDHSRLDLLINNAGVMWPPYTLTDVNVELQMAVNHLGHFALTGLLLDTLLATPRSRIVTVASMGHRRAGLDFTDLAWRRRRYSPPLAYGASKLANLMFTYELQRRLADRHASTIAVAAHPGASRTELLRHSARHLRVIASPQMKALFTWLLQDAPAGALPALRAAVDPSADGGDYFGPGGWREFTGPPVRVSSSPRSYDRSEQERLWQYSEELTGVTYRWAVDRAPEGRRPGQSGATPPQPPPGRGVVRPTPEPVRRDRLP